MFTHTPWQIQRVDPRWGSVAYTTGVPESIIGDLLGIYFLDPSRGLGKSWVAARDCP